MTAKEFFDLVSDMRLKQKEHFRIEREQGSGKAGRC